MVWSFGVAEDEGYCTVDVSDLDLRIWSIVYLKLWIRLAGKCLLGQRRSSETRNSDYRF